MLLFNSAYYIKSINLRVVHNFKVDEKFKTSYLCSGLVFLRMKNKEIDEMSKELLFLKDNNMFI
jgi:hypothetical protein